LATSASPTLDAAALGRFLDGPHAKVREEVREWLSREGNAPQPDLPLTEHRRQVLGWTKDLASTDRTHQRRLLIPLAGTYELHFAQEQLVGSMAEAFTGDGADDRQRRKLETSAAALKATGTWHASATIQECREAVGGQGYLKANRLAALKADTDVFTTFEGDNTVLLQLAAKNLLTDFQDEFGELDPLGTFAFVAEQVAGVVAERTAARELLGRIADDLLPGRAVSLARGSHQGGRRAPAAGCHRRRG